MGWAYLVSVIDCCTRQIVSWNLSHRCRTEKALKAVEQAVLARLPEGSRNARVTLTTDNGTQFTSTRFIATLNRLGIAHRRTAFNHPEGKDYVSHCTSFVLSGMSLTSDTLRENFTPWAFFGASLPGGSYR